MSRYTEATWIKSYSLYPQEVASIKGTKTDTQRFMLYMSTWQMEGTGNSPRVGGRRHGGGKPSRKISE